MKLCPCGRPLHYPDKLIEDYVEATVLIYGDCCSIKYDGRTWQVPRHYAVLHGIIPAELPELAAKYGFEEV